jgi:alkylated DNA nucleotide flippase Atl1
MAKKSANDLLNDSRDMPKISEVTDPKQISRYGGTKLLIAPPLAYDELMKKIPQGKVITADVIRSYLAKKHGADSTCPLTAGIFISMAAKASVERSADQTPYWRTLKKDGELNEKYPEGTQGQKLHLEMEGHTVIQKGNRYFVKNYQEQLFDLDASA